MEDKEEKKKPVAKVTGENGNVFLSLAICVKALKKAGMTAEAEELNEKVFDASSYEDAIKIMGQYCKLR